METVDEEVYFFHVFFVLVKSSKTPGSAYRKRAWFLKLLLEGLWLCGVGLFSIICFTNSGFGVQWRQCMRKCFLPRKKWSMVLCLVFLGFLERQGDLLSPFLYTIVAEASSALLARATDIGMIRGFEASWSGFILLINLLMIPFCSTQHLQKNLSCWKGFLDVSS